jgi:hypothetical protein
MRILPAWEGQAGPDVLIVHEKLLGRLSPVEDALHALNELSNLVSIRPFLEDRDLDTRFSVHDAAASKEDKVPVLAAFDPLDHEVSLSLRDRTAQIRCRGFLS